VLKHSVFAFNFACGQNLSRQDAMRKNFTLAGTGKGFARLVTMFSFFVVVFIAKERSLERAVEI